MQHVNARGGRGAAFKPRQAGQARMSAEVAVSWRCPTCGGDHPLAEHDGEETMRGLSVAELRRLHRSAEHELAQRVLSGEAHDDAARFVAAVASRISRHDGETAPSLEKRQRLYAERRV